MASNKSFPSQAFACLEKNLKQKLNNFFSLCHSFQNTVNIYCQQYRNTQKSVITNSRQKYLDNEIQVLSHHFNFISEVKENWKLNCKSQINGNKKGKKEANLRVSSKYTLLLLYL